MPRDGTGDYTLPPGNPVVTNTTITSSWANDTMQDLGLEITNSLSRFGFGGMLAPLVVPNGSPTARGYGFNSAAGAGMSIVGTDDLRFGYLNQDVARISPFGIQQWDAGSSSWKNFVIVGDNATFGDLTCDSLTVNDTGPTAINVPNGSITSTDLTLTGIGASSFSCSGGGNFGQSLTITTGDVNVNSGGGAFSGAVQAASYNATGGGSFNGGSCNVTSVDATTGTIQNIQGTETLRFDAFGYFARLSVPTTGTDKYLRLESNTNIATDHWQVDMYNADHGTPAQVGTVTFYYANAIAATIDEVGGYTTVSGTLSGRQVSVTRSGGAISGELTSPGAVEYIDLVGGPETGTNSRVRVEGPGSTGAPNAIHLIKGGVDLLLVDEDLSTLSDDVFIWDRRTATPVQRQVGYRPFVDGFSVGGTVVFAQDNLNNHIHVNPLAGLNLELDSNLGTPGDYMVLINDSTTNVMNLVGITSDLRVCNGSTPAFAPGLALNPGATVTVRKGNAYWFVSGFGISGFPPA